jgi:hypothetical protein
MVTALGLALLVTAAPDSLTFSGRHGDLEVSPPYAPSADVRVDGRLDEAIWGRAAVMSDFTQYEPVEGIPAVEPTEVRVFYTEEAIYFGVRAYDSDPSGILARLGERDRAVFGDDWVRIILDTFDDQRQAYVFYVNPLGLQTDGLWIEGLRRRGMMSGGVSIDYSPDFIWESDARVDDEGWTAEVRIPYVSLRFREVEDQAWGIQVAREVKRRAFKQSWAPLTSEISSTLAQSGRLVGLRNLRSRRLVEVNPVVTGVRTGSDASGAFVRSDTEADFGLNGRVGLTQNLVLDGTYNPDFSQVEADANRLSINERFAIFFPEKRTFFLEGAEIFNSPTNLVYTRRIVDPLAGARLTGKVGAFALGYIGAVDESPRTFGEATGNAVFNLVRARRDVGAGSTLGLLYTDRTLADGSGAFNRVVAGDTRLVFGGRYTLTAQLAGSLTRRQDQDGAGSLQPLMSAQFARGGRGFNWSLSFTDIHPDFVASSGFITRAGDTELNASMSFTRFGAPGALLESTRVRLVSGNYFEHDGFWSGQRPFEHELELWPTFTFRGDRIITLIFRNGYFRFLPEDYTAHSVQGPDGELPFTTPAALKNLLAVGVMPRLRLTNQSNLGGMFFLREVPIYLEGSRGREIQLSPSLELKPSTGLQLSVNHTFSRIWRQDPVAAPRQRGASSRYSTVNLSRLRVQYQFNKALFVRGVVQYELTDRAQVLDRASGAPVLYAGYPLDAQSDGEFQGQFLLQYEPSPGTIFYIGYTRLMEGDRTYRLGRMDPTEEGLFLKLSYLFRM